VSIISHFPPLTQYGNSLMKMRQRGRRLAFAGIVAGIFLLRLDLIARSFLNARTTASRKLCRVASTAHTRDEESPKSGVRSEAVFVVTLGSVLFLSMGMATAAPKFMDCGGAPLCGVLTLETGLGKGAYKHRDPVVHGLWPENGNYGSSKCIRPIANEANPKKVYSCYIGEKPSQQLSFEAHEWEKHGTCAGVRDAEEYFQQVCSLSSGPLQLMSAEKGSGANELAAYTKGLEAAGYSVFKADTQNMQVELAACANADGQWVLAKPSEFGARCGGTTAGKPPAATVPVKIPASTVPLQQDRLQCKLNQRGPACKTDADCGYSGCVRCAKSGFCTANSLQ